MYTEDWKASKGKYKVVGLDTFSHADWIDGEFDNEKDAIKSAKKKAGEMTLMRVYDDKEKLICEYGKY